MPGSYFTPTNKCTRQTCSTNTLNRHHHQTHNIHNIADIFRKTHSTDVHHHQTHSIHIYRHLHQTHSAHVNRNLQQTCSTHQQTSCASTQQLSVHSKAGELTQGVVFQCCNTNQSGLRFKGKTSGCQTLQPPQTYPKQFHQTASQDPCPESLSGNVLVSVNYSCFPQACYPGIPPVSCKEC